MSFRFFQFSLLSGMTALLIACGGGSSGRSTTSLSGVAAVGIALANASVTLKDSTGKTETTTTDESGNFTFNNVSSFTPPLMLQVKGSAAGISYVLHSVMTSAPALGTNTLNVTPATDAITTHALGSDPEITFNDAAAIKKIEPAKLADAKTKLVAALKDALTNLKIDNLDVMTGQFAADKTGMDKLFDLVEFSPNSTTGEIKLTNKNTRSSATFSSNASLNQISKLGLSKDEASLDLSGINTFVQSFIKAANNSDKTALPLILDKDYLNQGESYESVKNSTTTSTSLSKLTGAGYAVKKCDPSTKVCIGTLNVKISGVTYPMFMPIKLGADGKWRAYGDRAPFAIDLYPILTRTEFINASTKELIENKDAVGIALDFAGNSCADCNDEKYKSAEFEMSIDGGKSFTPLFKLRSKTITTQNNTTDTIAMGLDTGNGDVQIHEWINGLSSHFFPIQDTDTISKYNTAWHSGQLQIQIKAYTNNDYTGTQVIWKPELLAPLFSLDNTESIIKSQKLTIDATTLDTESVSFDGKNLVGTFFVAYSQNIQSLYSYGETFFYEEISDLKGSASPAKLRAQCVKDLAFMQSPDQINWQKEKCTAMAKSELKINEAALISQNSQGGRIYLNKRALPFNK